MCVVSVAVESVATTVESGVAALVSTVAGATVVLSVVAVESVVVVDSELLLQAVKAPAIKRIAKIFFIVVGFDLSIMRAKVMPQTKKPNSSATSLLLLPEKNTYRHSREIEMFPQFIFQVIFIRSLNIIRKVAKESK